MTGACAVLKELGIHILDTTFRVAAFSDSLCLLLSNNYTLLHSLRRLRVLTFDDELDIYDAPSICPSFPAATTVMNRSIQF